ncbi:hypothetical protein HaLaN_20111 [Haematococcus lacustris]|uniref:Uncharacterized protein n=1 Tax=Haematococcus lacustris TaxID=44745 RepID=A0A699ZIP8_HAELA|nr:hypothetical protein HaLaN_20111 [Haematococcus lacustris]
MHPCRAADHYHAMYQAFAGSDQSYTLGGGTAGFTLRRSSQGLQITPVVNQFNLAATFVPYVAQLP